MAPTDKTGVKRKQSAGRKKRDTTNTSVDTKDTISKLHAVIAKSNEERLALETATRYNLKDMEKAIMNKVKIMHKNVKQLTSSNKAIEETIQTLHEGQLSMNNNINMMMPKMGI